MLEIDKFLVEYGMFIPPNEKRGRVVYPCPV